jgi:site-specific DNA-methyltransferase (adenine-specific)
MKPTILIGDVRSELSKLESDSVQCCVTSPPYWGLRDYGVEGQIGLEKTPQDYVRVMVEVFEEVHRVLKPDGTCWINLGDSYCSTAPGTMGDKLNQRGILAGVSDRRAEGSRKVRPQTPAGLKPKDLVGIPWRVAFALQEAGWWLRSDIIWAKANCMPESVTDRPTRSHEYLFLLTKNSRYYYDAEAIKEPCIYDVDGTGTTARKACASANLKSHPSAERAGIRPAGFKDAEKFNGKDAEKFNGKHADKQRGHSRRHDGFNDRWDKMEREGQCTGMRNKRDVWTVAPANYPEAHFATFPPDLIKPCILAGSRPGDVVLDPFGGSGTTGQVALELGRKAILIELNPVYAKLIEKRCHITPGFL